MPVSTGRRRNEVVIAQQKYVGFLGRLATAEMLHSVPFASLAVWLHKLNKRRQRPTKKYLFVFEACRRRPRRPSSSQPVAVRHQPCWPQLPWHVWVHIFVFFYSGESYFWFTGFEVINLPTLSGICHTGWNCLSNLVSYKKILQNMLLVAQGGFTKKRRGSSALFFFFLWIRVNVQ